jgi:hypothetical protein
VRRSSQGEHDRVDVGTDESLRCVEYVGICVTVAEMIGAAGYGGLVGSSTHAYEEASSAVGQDFEVGGPHMVEASKTFGADTL